MVKVPRMLCSLIFMLVFAVVILPSIEENSIVSHAVENGDGSSVVSSINLSVPDDERLDETTTAQYPVATTGINLGIPDDERLNETTIAQYSLVTTDINLGIPDDDRLEHTTTENYVEYTTTTLPTTTVSNRISAIYVSDMVLIDGCDGYWSSVCYEDETGKYHCYEYYRYNIYPESVTVIFNDGAKISGSIGEVYDETGYFLHLNDSQSFENQWTVGEYYVSAFLGDAKTTFKVEIIDTPIESIEIEIEKTELLENRDGGISAVFNEDGEIEDYYFYYDVWLMDIIEITFKKGFEYYESDWHSYSVVHDQSYDNPWGVGKHTITFSYLGYEEDFEIEVIPNPLKVKNVSVVAGRKLIENRDGYVAGDYLYDELTGDYTKVEYFSYYDQFSNPIITVELDDGTTVTGEGYQIYNQIGIYPSFWSSQSYENSWGIGTHTAYLGILGEMYPYEVEVIANPITKIEFVKAPVKTEYILGETPNLKGAAIRIHYVSGEYADVSIKTDFETSVEYYDKKINSACYIELLEIPFATVGAGYVYVSYEGFECQYPVTILNKKIDVVTIKNSSNNDFLIDTYYSDGTVGTLKVISFSSDYGTYEPTYKMCGGIINTDKGSFNAELYFVDNSLSNIKIFDPTQQQWLQSNRINNCKWIELYFKIYIADLYFCCCDEPFDGEITKENVDDICALALLLMYPSKIEATDYVFYKEKDIVEAIKSGFVIDNVDITVSQNYDSLNNTIKINTDCGGGFPKPHSLSYENGCWIVEICYYSREPYAVEYMYVVFDDDLKIVSYNIGKKPVIVASEIKIKQPSETVISYGDSIVLHANVPEIPEGGYILWTASNGNFDYTVSDDGKTCTITPSKSGDTTFTVTVYDANGNAVCKDEQVMTSKAGLFQKIIAFFKKLFGLTKTIPELYKGIF